MAWSVVRGFIGVILAFIVIWLGIKTATAHPDPVIVALFGVCAALLGPTAIALIGGTFTSKRDEAFKQLAKAGEIQQKVDQADTVEEKLQALENERRQLSVMVRFEARREVILDRQKALKTEVWRLTDQTEKILSELRELETEGKLLRQEIDNSSTRSEVIAVRSRLLRESADPFHRLEIRLEGSEIYPPFLLTWIKEVSTFPFMGWYVRLYIRLMMWTIDVFDDLRARRLARQATHTNDDNGAQRQDKITESDGKNNPG